MNARDTLARLDVRSDPAELSRVRAFVLRALETKARDTEAYLVAQAVDEAVSNVIEHGYGGDPEGAIEVGIEVAGRDCRVWVRDTGCWFDPTEAAEIDVERHVREGRSRGLGLYLMRAIADDIRYERTDDGWHELYLEKHLAQ